jgi:hypothetical protein
MPRVHHVKKARKEIKRGDQVIVAVGDSYYYWEFRHGGRQVSKTPPRRSQLTQSDKLSRAYQAEEALNDLDRSLSYEDAASEVDSIASDIRDIAQEYRDSIENMPESLQQSSVAEQCEEKADELESWADSLESEAQSWDEETEMDSALDELEGCPL